MLARWMYCTFFAAVLTARPAAALEPAPAALSLAGAIAYARQHQPSIIAARARLEAARKDVAVADAERGPRVGAVAEIVGSTVNNSTAAILGDSNVAFARVGSSQFTGTGSPPNWRPYPTTLIGVSAQQPLYDFGRIAAQSAALSALADVERARVAMSRVDLDFSVAESFYAVLAARAVLDAASEAEKRALAHRNLAESGVRAGLRDPIALTRAEADFARFQVGHVRAERGLRIARITFASVVGYDARELDVTVEPDPAPPPQGAEEATVRRALDTDPGLRALEAVVRSQNLQSKAIAALLRPNLYASASLSMRAGGGPASSATAREPTYGGWLPEAPNYHLGLVLSVPLVDRSVRARAGAASARADAAQADLQLARLRVRQATLESMERVKQAEESLLALERAERAAAANADQAEARDRNGLGSSTELADAEALRADSTIQLAIGRYQLRTARAALARRIAEGT